MEISQQLTEEFNLRPDHVKNILNLLDEGNTIPFIARYRKEMTGAIDDQVLRAFNDRYEYLKNLGKAQAGSCKRHNRARQNDRRNSARYRSRADYD